jgi:hypothetical protein
MALSNIEGRRCLRSLLSFDLEALDRVAAYKVKKRFMVYGIRCMA